MSANRTVNPFIQEAAKIIEDPKLTAIMRVAQLEKWLDNAYEIIKSYSDKFEQDDLPHVEAIGKELIVNLYGINSVDSYGETILHKAARRGRVECVDYLLAKGADVNVQTNNGDTPIQLAVKHQNIGCMIRLIKAKADLEIADSSYYSPLRAAASAVDTRYQERILRALTDAKADVNAKQKIIYNTKEVSALSLLLDHHSPFNKEGSVLALLEAGADPNLKLNSGVSHDLRSVTALTIAYSAAGSHVPHYRYVSMLYRFAGVLPISFLPEVEIQLENALASDSKRKHLNFCMASIHLQKQNVDRAIYYFQQAANLDFGPAYTQLGIIADCYARNFISASTNFSLALHNQDILAANFHAKLAEKMTLALLDNESTLDPIENGQVLTQLQHNLQRCNWKVGLSCSSWSFVAMDALGNKAAFSDPAERGSVALVAAKKAVETASTSQEKEEASITSGNVWRFFHRLTNKASEESLLIGEGIIGAYSASDLIGEYCNDDSVASAVAKIIKPQPFK